MVGPVWQSRVFLMAPPVHGVLHLHWSGCPLTLQLSAYANQESLLYLVLVSGYPEVLDLSIHALGSTEKMIIISLFFFYHFYL